MKGYLSSNRFAPREPVRTTKGRYVWEPALEVIYFIPRGKQRALYVIPLDKNQNTDDEVMRKIGRDLNSGNYARETEMIHDD